MDLAALGTTAKGRGRFPTIADCRQPSYTTGKRLQPLRFAFPHTRNSGGHHHFCWICSGISTFNLINMFLNHPQIVDMLHLILLSHHVVAGGLPLRGAHWLGPSSLLFFSCEEYVLLGENESLIVLLN